MISESTPRTFAGRRRHRVRSEKALAHGVQRARSDVAVNDAECGQGERNQPLRTCADGRQEILHSADGLADGLAGWNPLPESLWIRPTRWVPRDAHVASLAYVAFIR